MVKVYTHGKVDINTRNSQRIKAYRKGVFTWLDGSKYMGQYTFDKANGQGTFIYSNGDKYLGEWKTIKKKWTRSNDLQKW